MLSRKYITGISPACTKALHQRRKTNYQTVYCNSSFFLSKPSLGTAPATCSNRFTFLSALQVPGEDGRAARACRASQSSFTFRPLPLLLACWSEPYGHTVACVLPEKHIDAETGPGSCEDIPSPNLHGPRVTARPPACYRHEEGSGAVSAGRVPSHRQPPAGGMKSVLKITSVSLLAEHTTGKSRLRSSYTDTLQPKADAP